MSNNYYSNIAMMEMNMMGMCMCRRQLKQVINLTESVDNSYYFYRGMYVPDDENVKRVVRDPLFYLSEEGEKIEYYFATGSKQRI